MLWETRVGLGRRCLNGWVNRRWYVRGRRERPQMSDSQKMSLDDAAMYGDLHTAMEDEWPSSPYPKSERRILKAAEVERPKIDPDTTSVLLFPGQGSQFLGMGRNLIDFPNVRDIYDCASEILGFDLLKLCLEGPKEQLDMTANCQPAVFVTSLAAVERLRDEIPSAIENCVATAGFSVGEYAALTFAGSINFESAVRLVKARAKAMQKASEMEPSGMATAMTRASSKLSLAMQTAKNYMKQEGYTDPVCQIANHLFVQCKVIGAHEAALKFFMDNAGSFNVGPIKRLPVSGAFHTPLMHPAVDDLEDALNRTKGLHKLDEQFMKHEIVQPLITVYSNVDGNPHSKTPREIKRKLVQQLYRPVRWEKTMCSIYDRDALETFPKTYEMGPGNQLTTILKRINGKAGKKSTPIKV